MAKKNVSSNEKEIQRIAIEDLDFDPQNPRFSRYFELESQPEAQVIEMMVRAENVQELMGSIGEQGYFVGEPLLVAKSDSKLIVVEGNRRLAALKLLSGNISPNTRMPSVEALKAEAKNPPSDVECIVFDDRRDILRYLGYRHITGAKKWDSLSKARYLKQLRDEFYSGMDEDEQHRSIAREIGSRKDYVAQMLAGLNVFERAEQQGFYGLQRVRAEDVDFGVLTTALSYSNIAEFVGLENRGDVQGENINDGNVKSLLSWIFAQDQNGETILGESRNLRKLSAVVASAPAVEQLLKGASLETAYLHTEGPAKAFTAALNNAHKRLVSVYELVPDIERFDREQLQLIEKINDLSEDVRTLIEKGIRRQKREAAVDE
ncbi:ParB N-terminal domain-containing protein [Pseudomonas oryzihabitans]|uniref:ParB/Sulfiredoxin domain-containing protein n=1 Tax=Pseudomonas oryzihabitans TaxID=47885 RepID=A0AAJ2BG86_9PSED|nr:ParB N-terminal domain-containing protein [Pseudomonas psychrotolerans]MDR6233569.1 hypothetical protein [Pseudomonas psychrotolerans]MDR6357388.1 hypothetical protein [Pseudomonas psychrotolerans]